MTDLVYIVAEHWGWTGVSPVAVTGSSRFGHLVVRDAAGACWYLDPETATLEQVAGDVTGLAAFWADPDVEERWRSEGLVDTARATLGDCDAGSCYGFKVPPVLGGGYDAGNLCILPLPEVIGFSGDLARRIHALPDGTAVRLKVVP